MRYGRSGGELDSSQMAFWTAGQGEGRRLPSVAAARRRPLSATCCRLCWWPWRQSARAASGSACGRRRGRPVSRCPRGRPVTSQPGHSRRPGWLPTYWWRRVRLSSSDRLPKIGFCACAGIALAQERRSWPKPNSYAKTRLFTGMVVYLTKINTQDKHGISLDTSPNYPARQLKAALPK